MLDAFLITKKLVEDGFAPEAWSGPDKQHFTIDYSAFLLRRQLQEVRAQGSHREGTYEEVRGQLPSK